MLKLDGRTCYFAGATGNIGRAAVFEMASQGMNVIMATHDPVSAKEIILAGAGLPGKITAAASDRPLEEVLKEAEETYGSVDVFLSSTGSMSVAKGMEEITAEDLKKKLDHLVTDPFRDIRITLPFLKRSKAPRIILCASAGALNGLREENIADNIARGAVVSMTYSLAEQLMPYGITVNCIVRSGMINDHDPHSAQTMDASWILPHVPMGRLGLPEEFGAAVSYLVSEEAGFVSGQILQLDGGMTIGC